MRMRESEVASEREKENSMSCKRQPYTNTDTYIERESSAERTID